MKGSTDGAVTVLSVPADVKKDSAINKFLRSNWLVIGEVIVIFLAKINPSFGASGGPLKPEFFISKLGVFTIFFINGIALSISGSPSELQSTVKTNILIQTFNFAIIPLMAKLLVPFYPVPEFRQDRDP